MKSIINAKNAISLLFLVPILTSAISLAMPNDVNYFISHSIYAICYLALSLSCFYLAKTDNEFISSKNHKFSMYLLSCYYLLINTFIYHIFPLFNQNEGLYGLIKNGNEDTSATMTIYFIFAGFGLIYIIAFLMFFWGIPTKKSYRWLLTLIFFIPSIVDLICPFLVSTFENIIEYRYMIVQSFDIACWGLMFYITLKTYKL